jgi:hypothetical protein
MTISEGTGKMGAFGVAAPSNDGVGDNTDRSPNILISTGDGRQWPAAAALPPEKRFRLSWEIGLCGPQGQ